ncbi:MAG: hypothetical protein IT422_16190 [Pirellulaceae bacterium]|jgi:Tfp pilus assembly protein FimT|nr:hypothetical protein [Pirellulaceae bacterium]
MYPSTNRTVLPKSRAFTLLELVIVLLLMVGVLAVVWPNLQRPLQRTSLDEAAQMVRDAIDESRYQAALHGAVQFVQLQQGSSQLRSGSFDGFLNSNSDISASLPAALSDGATTPQAASSSYPGTDSANSSGLGAERSTAVRTQTLRTWQLPPPVVISNVDWTLESIIPSGVDDQIPFDSDEYETEREYAADTALDPTTNANEFDPATSRQWWLPLTAEGRGRDASIELFDASIDQRLYVTYSAATGALEISR